MRWRDAPKEYGPHKTIYNRFIRWSRLDVFSRILAELAAKRGKPEQLMIDATHLKGATFGHVAKRRPDERLQRGRSYAQSLAQGQSNACRQGIRRRLVSKGAG
ncbi:transposase [Rhizobium leguminosarum]|uniref:Transposase n=1 Tax=Rhizobium leguminosarum TaxID=384 RepID=A0ACD5F710_RHILE